MDLSMMIEDVKFNYRAALMIKKGDSILVECNPDIDFVTIPGGRVKTLESSLDALQREIKEEMHVDILETEVKMKALIENFFEMNNKKYHEIYFLYKITIDDYDTRFTDDMINFDSDASYYKWVKISNLAKENLLPVVLRSLSDDDNFQNIINNDLKKDID
jgi:ADP-ribose pyrophosphatase YjhB (NUDIX family)